METLYDLLSDLPPGTGVVAPRTTYDADAVRGTAFKTGNFLRTLGVREGVRVGVAATRRAADAAKPAFAFLGAGLLGATVRFDPGAGDGLRAYLASTDRVRDLDLPAGGQYVGWGDRPDDPRVEYFERDVWSENPAFPPVSFDGDTGLLETPEAIHTHADLLNAAGRLEEAVSGPLVIDAALTHPGCVAAVLAALRAGERVHVHGDAPPASEADVVRVACDGEAAIDPRNVEI